MLGNIMNHEFFGLKNKFGIEIEIFSQKKQIGKARFWIGGKPFGEFTVKHKLTYLIKGLKATLKDEPLLWDDRFENKTPEQIATICWLLDRNRDDMKTDDFEHFEKVKNWVYILVISLMIPLMLYM